MPYPNPPQSTIKANTDDVNTQTLADYLPSGEVYRAKNTRFSNTRRLLEGIAKERTREEQKIVEVVDEYDPSTTHELIAEWESALGIPDSCFDPAGKTIEARRRYVVAKLARMNLTNRQDFIDLAAFFGINVTITGGGDYAAQLPFRLPSVLGTGKAAKFTMVVKFVDYDKPLNELPAQLPFPLGTNNPYIDLIQCLFLKLRPANVNIVWLFKNSI